MSRFRTWLDLGFCYCKEPLEHCWGTVVKKCAVLHWSTLLGWAGIFLTSKNYYLVPSGTNLISTNYHNSSQFILRNSYSCLSSSPAFEVSAANGFRDTVCWISIPSNLLFSIRNLKHHTNDCATMTLDTNTCLRSIISMLWHSATSSSTRVHVHFLTDHVTRPISYTRSLLLVLQLCSQELPREDA